MIDEGGENIGVVKLEEAVTRAREKGLSLVEVASKANPPVCRIIDLGKFKYKKSQKTKKKAHKTTLRKIRINLGTSEHDLAVKAKKASTFLEKGDRVKIELMLKGRSKFLEKEFIEGRLKRILNFLSVKHKVSDEPKKDPKGISILIEKSNP